MVCFLMITISMLAVQVLNKVITVYAALCSEVKKLKYEVRMGLTAFCLICEVVFYRKYLRLLKHDLPTGMFGLFVSFVQ